MKQFTKISLSIGACQAMADAAAAKAEQLGIAISITIVDESGVIKFFSRMDKAPLVSVDASRKKAVTAVGLGFSTGDTSHSFIKDDPILFNGVQQLHDFILLGGGSPVKSGDHMIGAIGISGGHYRQDEQCVIAAIDTFNAL